MFIGAANVFDNIFVQVQVKGKTGDGVGGHHDRFQGARRFATVLIYLNEGKRGGQTVFPLFNSDTSVKSISAIRKWYSSHRNKKYGS